MQADLAQENPEAPEPDPRDAFSQLIDSVIDAAFKTSAFDTVCTVLRVGGLADANWDPFEESRAAFDDYNWALQSLAKERGHTAARRLTLLMYCQAVEMTAPHEILANLLRVIAKQHYVFDPFQDLWRHSKSGKPSVPPSAKTKFRRIQEMARKVGRADVADAIDGVFDDRLRNAFAHSDYVLTPERLRFSEGRHAQQIEVADLDKTVSTCFAFYGAFIVMHRRWLEGMSRAKRFHKWPNYEVLELLSSPELGLYGFHLHFSNGSKATYTRRPEGTEAINFGFENDSGLYFMVGDLDAREPVWMVNGTPVLDWAAMP